MTTNRETASTHPITTSLEQLSKGIDRILKRWVGPNRPTKLALLNDVAAAIRPGANWGALKSPRQAPAPTYNTSFISNPPNDAKVLPARLFPIPPDSNHTSIHELTDDIMPLFTMRHEGDPIIGLELSAYEGNGYCEVSIFPRLILARGNSFITVTAYSWDLDPEIARLVYLTVQNLQHAAIYPALAQADSSCLHVILGPCHVAAALPDAHLRSAAPDVPSQGARILFDEGDVPSAESLGVSLRLMSNALSHLEIGQFPHTEAVQFRISQPLTEILKPVVFNYPEDLDERTLFRRPKKDGWVHDGSFLRKAGISEYGNLGEAMDLALALIEVDDPDLYLNVSLTSEPKRKPASRAKPGGRGGFLRGWRILKLKAGMEPQVLSLDTATQNRLETGLNGWAIYEGYSITEDKTKVAAEALVARDLRRGSHHMEQVRAIMDGANPEDTELIRTLETKPYI